MAGAAQGDRAGRDASGGSSGSRVAAGIGQFAAIQSVAPSLGVELTPVTCATPVRSSGRHGLRASTERRPDRDSSA